MAGAERLGLFIAAMQLDARTAEDWGFIEKAVLAAILDGAIEECSKNSLPTGLPARVYKRNSCKNGEIVLLNRP